MVVTSMEGVVISNRQLQGTPQSVCYLHFYFYVFIIIIIIILFFFVFFIFVAMWMAVVRCMTERKDSAQCQPAMQAQWLKIASVFARLL